VRGKQYSLCGALALSLSLSACGHALPIGQNRPLRLPTATRGVEAKGAATVAPAGATAAVDQPAAPGGTAGPAVQPAQSAASQAPQAPATMPAPPASPTVNPVLANVQLPAPADLQARWRQIQVDRTPLDPHRTYVSPAYQIVWWFDPIFGQIVPIGQLRGEFTVQATFRIRGQWIGALELPYHLNQQYGFTVPEAIVKRMKDAGIGEWAEVFVYQTQDIQPK
jgi:hypothetical protein